MTAASRRLVARPELLGTLVERQLRLRAKRSLVGVVWPLTAPLFLFFLYRFVFGSVFAVPVDHYGVYLFAGLLPWTFLVQSMHDSLQSISFEPDLVRRAPFPYHYLPLARVAVMALPFAIQLVVFTVVVVAGTDVPVDLRLLPALVVPVASVGFLVAGLTMLIALIDVFNRDLRYVLTNLLTIWFFMVPIVYDRAMVSDLVRTITSVDPMRWIVGQFRDVLHEGRIDDPVAHLVTLLACVTFFVLTWVVFRRGSVDLAKDV